MSESREMILGTIRHNLRQGKIPEAQQIELVNRLHAHPRGIIPALTQLPPEQLITLFIKNAEKFDADVVTINHFDILPDFISQYLTEKNLPLEIRAAPHPLIQNIPWNNHFTIKAGAAIKSDNVGITVAQSGVAETGTLVFTSGPLTPTTLNFVPLVQIALLAKNEIVGSYEDAWDRIRKIRPLPRTINFITGTSRTADIEQELLLGVHGPKFLLIILYETEA